MPNKRLRVVVKQNITHKGVFAKKKIKQGEIILDFKQGGGRFFSDKERNKLPEKYHHYDIQVGDNLFFGATNESEVDIADYINHSCNPDAGIKGALKLVAIRDIKPNEEITFDYAMSESHTELNMRCRCSQPHCRKIITGDDWKIPTLQRKYHGSFSDYLQKKINALKEKPA